MTDGVDVMTTKLKQSTTLKVLTPKIHLSFTVQMEYSHSNNNNNNNNNNN